MSPSNINFLILLISSAYCAQLEAQMEKSDAAQQTFQALKSQINGKGLNVPSKLNAEINQVNANLAGAFFNGNKLQWGDVEESLHKWRKAFTSSTEGSKSGSVVAISKDYILKSESWKFYENFGHIQNSYYKRGSDKDSCLQKIRFIFVTEPNSMVFKPTVWFVIENSNKHAAERMQFQFDMKASRGLASNKMSSMTGEQGKLGFTDDFFYMKQMQEWNFLNLKETQRVAKAIGEDMKIFRKHWKDVKLVDFSLLVFVNAVDQRLGLDKPVATDNCVRFTRKNPKTEDDERLEMCFSIIDFFAHLSLPKKTQGKFFPLIKVFDQGKKFTENYATDLEKLANGMLLDKWDSKNYIPEFIRQSRGKHQQKVIDLAKMYQKKHGTDSFQGFRDDYYHKHPHGLRSFALKTLYDICALGLTHRKRLQTFVEVLEIKDRMIIDHSAKTKWNNIEKELSLQPTTNLEKYLFALTSKNNLFKRARQELEENGRKGIIYAQKAMPYLKSLKSKSLKQKSKMAKMQNILSQEIKTQTHRRRRITHNLNMAEPLLISQHPQISNDPRLQTIQDLQDEEDLEYLGPEDQ